MEAKAATEEAQMNVKILATYIISCGVVFMILGAFATADWFNRNLDYAVGMSGITRFLTGTVFLVGGIAVRSMVNDTCNVEIDESLPEYDFSLSEVELRSELAKLRRQV